MRTLLMTLSMLVFMASPGTSLPVAMAQPGAPPPASGQGSGYYPPGPPPASPTQSSGFLRQRGLTFGFGAGLGDMSSDTGPIECLDCDYKPMAAGFDFHIGAMLNPRLALLFETWGTLKQLDALATETLSQTFAMVAAQYWVSPRLWLKGGVGIAHLSVTYDDGIYSGSEPVADGGALMGAVGYEIMTSSRFSIDLQVRLGIGSYQEPDAGYLIQGATMGAGINWY